MSKAPYDPFEISDELAAALEDHHRSQPKNPPAWDVRLDEQELRSILVKLGAPQMKRSLEDLYTDLNYALSQYAVDAFNAKLQIVPSKLIADLDKIEKAAINLSELFKELRDAEDAMVRILHPGHYEAEETLYRPPEFVARMLQISEIARLAQAEASENKHYVRARRGDLAVNRLIASLLAVWNRSFQDRAAFSSSGSLFVMFVLECLKLVGLRRYSIEALAKRCGRVAQQAGVVSPKK